MSTSDATGPAPDEQLATAVQARLDARGLDGRIEGARVRAEISRGRAQTLAARLTAEERDVERLQKLSWSRTLSALRGSHSTDLERETAERDAARYEADVAESRALTDQREVESLLSRRGELGDVEAAYAAALGAKEEWLAGRDHTLAARLREIADERGRLGAEDRENREAFEAGRRAHQHLSDAAASLDSARSWSSWDTFGGGGLFSDAMKYDRLDAVGQDLRQADTALRSFTDELADVHLPAVRSLEIGSMTTTFDVWFDNIFSDWAVRDRIVEAGERVQVALTEVARVLDRLQARGGEIAERLGVLTSERETLLGG
jgi:hypothetical protein